MNGRYPGSDSIARQNYEYGCQHGREDAAALAHMSSVYQRCQDHYDSRFEDAFRRGCEQGWAAFRMK